MLVLPARLMAFTTTDYETWQKDSFVRISILSKRIKQIKDKNLKEIVMSFPDESVADNIKNGNHLDINKLSIIFENDELSIIVDDKKMEGQFHLIDAFHRHRIHKTIQFLNHNHYW